MPRGIASQFLWMVLYLIFISMAGCGGGSKSPNNAVCGNGILEPSEKCDDGNTADNDGCSSACSIEDGWGCSTGNPSVCTKTLLCGNGVIEGAEGCDDKNKGSGDGCSSICLVESGWNCTGQPSKCTRTSSGMLRMNMKSYGNHDEYSYSNLLAKDVLYDERILTIKPEFVIDDPPHGLYGEMDNPKYTGTWLLQDIAGYHAAGIKIIGYISGGYEGTGGDDRYNKKWYSLATNKMLIANMATIDHVDGVFIDECTDFPKAASKSYLTELSKLAHSYGMIVWMNVGVDDFDEWFFTVADFMQSSEEWIGQDLSDVQKKWGSKISVTGFKESYDAQKAYDLTKDAWCKGLAYCYINDVEYTSIAPWFEQYAQKLRDWNGACP